MSVQEEVLGESCLVRKEKTLTFDVNWGFSVVGSAVIPDNLMASRVVSMTILRSLGKTRASPIQVP